MKIRDKLRMSCSFAFRNFITQISKLIINANDSTQDHIFLRTLYFVSMQLEIAIKNCFIRRINHVYLFGDLSLLCYIHLFTIIVSTLTITIAVFPFVFSRIVACILLTMSHDSAGTS
jgi:hypothetical protein